MRRSTSSSQGRSALLLLVAVLLLLPGCRCRKRGQRHARGDRFDLVEAAGASVSGVAGKSRVKIVFTRPGCEGDWRLRKKRARVRVHGLPPGAMVELTSTPDFAEPVLLKANGAGRAKWTGRVPGSTAATQTFEFGVLDMAGGLLASGTSKVLSRSTVRVQTNHKDPRTGITIDSRFEGTAATGQERIWTRFAGIEPGARVRLLACDPRESGGEPDVAVAESTAGLRGAVTFIFDTEDAAHALPFGARRMRDLWGVPLTLVAGGQRLSLGTVPEHDLNGAADADRVK